MRNTFKFIGLIALTAVVFTGCLSIFGGGGGGTVRLPNAMVGKWYRTVDAAVAGDESELRYEVMADGRVIYHGGDQPAMAQITSFRRGEDVRSHVIDGVENKQTISFFTSTDRDAAAGTQTLRLHVMGAPRGNPVFVNSRTYKASSGYTAPAARPTYDDPPAADALQLIATWNKPGNPPVTLQFTADGRLIYGNTNNVYRVSGNNIVLDNNNNSVLQYRINGNQLTISSTNVGFSAMLGGTYTRQ